jgi:histidinol-phosphatase
MQNLDDLMDFAARTAEAAGDLTLDHFGRAAVEFKGDGSEVTAADRAAEELIRVAIRERFPDDGLLGEEGTAHTGTSRRRWVIDPIDGTRSFAAGVPLYGVLIALEEEGEPILGCCHFPALRDTVVAARGAGAWRNGERARVSEVDSLSAARVVTSGLEYWRDWATDEGREGWTRLLGQARFGRTWGDCYGYVLVATGRADVMADPAVGAAWDYAPLIPILAEAGGRFTTLAGAPPSAWRSAIATNGVLHEAARGCWRGAAELDIQVPELRGRGE